MLQILFQYTQWKVALTVTIQRMLENQHRSGILSSDYSFGDEERSGCKTEEERMLESINCLEYLRPQTLFLASVRFACQVKLPVIRKHCVS